MPQASAGVIADKLKSRREWRAGIHGFVVTKFFQCVGARLITIRLVTSVPDLEDDTPVRQARANAHVAAVGVMIAPVAVMTVADDNRSVARAHDDFGGSRKGSQYHRGDRSAQNKQSHLDFP
jgi:hypothetical protein